MTLTVVVGSSGSGKTTFLNDVVKHCRYSKNTNAESSGGQQQGCIYIRQFHNLRPYITVTKIPHFDPTLLPYWDIYVNEDKAATIKVGGTMAGEFTAGLSGGQRKLLLFELICQRLASFDVTYNNNNSTCTGSANNNNNNKKRLLVIFDEPFAGVTDDFVPYIMERIEQIRINHSVVIVTNDHISTLTSTANNMITVSAIDRNHVTINNHTTTPVRRESAIRALDSGDVYIQDPSTSAFQFFLDIEIYNNQGLYGVAGFTIFMYVLLILTFWDSSTKHAVYVLVGADVISFFSINPYLMSLVDWRNAVTEESEALVHSSERMNKALKTSLAMLLIFIISWINYGCCNLVVDGLEDIRLWVAMFFDAVSVTLPLILLSIYTTLPFIQVENLGNLPFLFMMFFSTTFSPGAGLPVVKELRYLFPRFYFWCLVPGVQEAMENCPSNDNLTVLYLILTSLICVVLFMVCQLYYISRSNNTSSTNKRTTTSSSADNDNTNPTNVTSSIELKQLQKELYGPTTTKRENNES